MSSPRLLTLVASAVALVLLPVARASAQSVPDLGQALMEQLPVHKVEAPAKQSPDEKAVERIRKALKYFIEQDDKLWGFSGTVEGGFHGDRTDKSSLYNLETKAELRKGSYPREVRVKLGTNVAYKDNKLQEEVASLVINQDYHLTKKLETFGFVERFSDNFLSIGQRYEAGIGLKLELETSQLATDKFEHDWSPEDGVLSSEDCAAVEHAEQYFKGRSEPGDEESPSEKLEQVKKKARELRRAYQKAHARLGVGLSASIFAELEQASIKLQPPKPADGSPQGESVEIQLPAEQKIRGALRPSIVFRPTEHLEISGLWYIKYLMSDPLGPDWRNDGYVTAKLKLPNKDRDPEVSLVASYERHQDNQPPRVTDEMISAQAPGKGLTAQAAEDSHRVFGLSLQVEF